MRAKEIEVGEMLNTGDWRDALMIIMTDMIAERETGLMPIISAVNHGISAKNVP